MIEILKTNDDSLDKQQFEKELKDDISTLQKSKSDLVDEKLTKSISQIKNLWKSKEKSDVLPQNSKSVSSSIDTAKSSPDLLEREKYDESISSIEKKLNTTYNESKPQYQTPKSKQINKYIPTTSSNNTDISWASSQSNIWRNKALKDFEKTISSAPWFIQNIVKRSS